MPPVVGGVAGFSGITCGPGSGVDGPVKTGGTVYVGIPPLRTGPGTDGGGALTAIGPDGGEKHAHSAGLAITGPLTTGAGVAGVYMGGQQPPQFHRHKNGRQQQ
jgi:hypothetical protein